MEKFLKSEDGIIKSKFLSLETRNDVAKLLEISTDRLNFFLYKSSDRYRSVNFHKKNGTIRKILIPNKSNKILQSKLLYALNLVTVTRRVDPVHGFKKGKSILTNAKVHVGSTEVLNLDLKDFFPSINFGRVRGLFMSEPFLFSNEVATTLAHLCCYENELPQGAPTSPAISNMIAFKLDGLLLKFSRKYRVLYTRYADDITLSSKNGTLGKLCHYEMGTWILSDEITSIVSACGFRINIDKTRYRKIGKNISERLEVTNIIINEKLNVSRKYIREVRAILNNWSKKGKKYATIRLFNKYRLLGRIHPARENINLKRVVAGKLNFIKFVRGENDKVYRKYANQYLELSQSSKPQYTFDLEAHFETNTVIIETNSGHKVYCAGFYIKGIGIVTASHAVQGKKEIRYSLPGGIFSNAQVIYCNVDKDFAVLLPIEYINSLMYSVLVEDDTLLKTPYTLESEPFKKGSKYKTCGYPSYTLGMEPTLSECTLIGQRPTSTTTTYLTQEPLYEGNSGGPVFDFSTGNVIGMAIRGGVKGSGGGASEILPTKEIIEEIRVYKMEIIKQLISVISILKS